MSQKTRAIFLLMTIVAVLFVSAFGTTNVYADDGTPPPPPAETGEVDPPPTGEAEPAATEPAVEAPPVEETEEAPVTEPTDEVVPSEDAPVVEEAPVVDEAPVVEEEQPAEAEAAPILEQVPDNTEVTVLNAEGEAQPLTSQESAEAIATSDPIWCPDTAVAPVPGENGCTGSYDSFTELLTFLKANETDPAYQQAGTIYVQMGNYAGPESSIDFDSYNFTSLNQQDLTIQGGWSPDDYSTDGTTTLNNVPVVIGVTNPWIGSLTFNNLTLTGNSNSNTGLTVVSESNITLSNVQVTNFGGGADLDAGGDVNIQESKFNGNKKFGATIKAGGFVGISDSEFNNNADASEEDGFGLKIDNQGSTSLAAVTANSNEEFGADINSAGSISVSNSVFSGNVAYTTECKWVARAAGQNCHQVCVTVKNGGGYGLKAVSTGEDLAGEIYLKRVTADNNYLFGAHLEGTLVTLNNEEVDGVIVGNSFSGNGSGAMDKPTGYGLEIVSTMTQDTIEEFIDLGILEEGQAAVTLRNVEANDNQLFGANVQAAGDVVISDSFFDGNKSYTQSCSYKARPSCNDYVCTKDYYGYGLEVVTTGRVNLYTVSASNNHLFGAHLKGANVAVEVGFFSGNGSGSSSVLTGEGLKIESGQNVNLVSVAANNNQLLGAKIEAVDVVNITLSTFNGQQVFSGTKVVDGGYGLDVVATGARSEINLTAVTASDNYLYGMHLSAYSVDIAGLNGQYTRAERNKEGIKIEATGPVTIDMLQANENKLFGADILSGLDATFDGTVIITNSFFNGNASYTSSKCKGKTYYGYGLRVVTTADEIILNGVEANDNYLYGAYLKGADIDVSNGTFDRNSTGNLADHIGQGLEIESTGSSSIVNLYNVSASNNQMFGAKIQAEGLVVVDSSIFKGNHSYASSCTSKSSSSYGKGGSGSGKSCGGKECTNTYYGYGLQVITTGSVYLYSVKAEENYLYGAHLEGSYVEVNDSVFSNNVSPTQKDKTPTGRGLEVKSTGDALLKNVHADNNQLFGATIEADGVVTVLSSTFMNNKYSTATSCKGTKSAGYGLKVIATEPAIESPITLENVTASGNGAEGAILQGETAAIAVTDSTFNNNGADGLNVTTSGNVTLTNVIADSNKDDGVDVKGVCTSTVTVSGGNFTNNDKYGLKVVDTAYAPDAANPPTFSGNDSGNVFQSGCGNSGGGSGSGNSGGGNTGGNNGSNWWYWWWYWHKGR